MATLAKITDLKIPTIALVGRVNAGKSTLFNKITETNDALVSEIPGTTRTRNINIATWRGKNFRIIDTGGLTFTEDIPLEDDIIKQTEIAIKEADLIIFVTDIQEGLLPQEKEIVKLIAGKKPILFVANKADTNSWRTNVHEKEWLRLGLGEPIPVSAINGSGLGDLLDKIFTELNKLKIRPKKMKEVTPIRVAIIGKPNVGKSSLFNKLIGEESVIVNDMPHTTREPHDTLVEVDGKHLLFVDTAGIRRKTKVSGQLEREGIAKSIQAVYKADIILFVITASEPITDQDMQLGGLLREHAKSVIIVVNKWDLSADNSDAFRNDVKKTIYNHFPHLSYAPIVFVSAETQYRVHQIFPLIEQAWKERHIEIPEEELRQFMLRITKQHLPTRGIGVRHPKILALKQINITPPIFEIAVKAKTSVHISYAHYVENRLREQFGFFATPIVIKFKKIKQ